MPYQMLPTINAKPFNLLYNIEPEPDLGHRPAQLHPMLQVQRPGVGPVWLPLAGLPLLLVPPGLGQVRPHPRKQVQCNKNRK